MGRLRPILFLITVCVACGNASIAQTTIIKGKALSYEGKEISLYSYTDFITFSENKLTSAMVSDKGEFELKVDVKKTTPVFVKVADTKCNMYLEPGSQYSVAIPKDSGDVKHSDHHHGHSIDMVFYLKDTTDINSLLIDYNERIEWLFIKYYPLFIKRRARVKMDSFKLATRKYYATLKKPYLDTHVEYNIAAIEENTFGRSENNIARDYLFNRPIQYDHMEYMMFFNDFYKQNLGRFSLSKEGAAIISHVENANYQGMMDAMRLDKYLKNDTIREYVMLKGLWEFYYSGKHNKESIARILEEVKEKSKIPDHRRIAGNMLNAFPKIAAGKKAPDFTLTDLKGKKYTLSDLKGKHVYIAFWATWCTSCLEEMKVIQDLKKKYGNKIVFLSISTDKSVDEVKKFFGKGGPKYDWPILFCDDPSLKEKYDVTNAPAYFLIDNKGYFLRAPAEGPVDIGPILQGIAKPAEKKTGVGSKQN